jgi:hypothetical protein
MDGTYVQEDDGNPVWEDIDDEDDDMVEAEARWRANDINNGEQIPDVVNMPQGSALAKAHAQVCDWILYATALQWLF